MILIVCCSVVVSVAALIDKIMNWSGCCSVVVSVTGPIEKVMNLSGC